ILVGEIVSLFTRALSEGRLYLRLLITSRPQIHIESTATDPDVSPSIYMVKLQDFSADVSIRAFLRASFSEIYRKNRQVMADVELPWPSGNAIDAVVRQASGLFVCASTVVKFVDNRYGRPDKQLEHIM